MKSEVLCAVSTFFDVASGADGMDVPQGLHEGGIHLDVAI